MSSLWDLQETYTFTNNVVKFGEKVITELHQSGKKKKLVWYPFKASVIAWVTHLLSHFLISVTCQIMPWCTGSPPCMSRCTHPLVWRSKSRCLMKSSLTSLHLETTLTWSQVKISVYKNTIQNIFALELHLRSLLHYDNYCNPWHMIQFDL